MTLKRSTGMRNEQLAKQVTMTYAKTHVVSSVDFVTAGSSSSGNPEIQNSSGDGTDWSTMFAVGDQVTVSGSSNDDDVYTITNIPASTRLEVESEAVTMSGDTAQTCVLSVANGGAWKDIFRNGVLVIFAGSQPSSADDDESGYTQLCQITLGSGTFSAGSGVNGINFGTASSGTLSKNANETWSGNNDSDGTAGWFRFYDNSKSTGASTSAIRFDGAIATSGAELNMSSTSFTSGVETVINSFDVTLPSS